MVSGASGEFRPVPLARGVYVAGENGSGHLVKATREGSAGSPWLAMVTDALITDPQAGLMRARAELGATGNREIYQFTLPLDDGGLILPGELVNVIETPSVFWAGQSVGWSISASHQDDALVIWQNVTVERYTDE